MNKTRVDVPFIAHTVPYIIITALIAVFDGTVAFDLFNIIYTNVAKGTAMLMSVSLVLVIDGIPILYAHLNDNIRKQKAVKKAKIFMLISIALVFASYFSQRLLSSDLTFAEEVTDIYNLNVAEQLNEEVSPMTKLLRLISVGSLGLLPLSTSAFNYALSIMNREYSLLVGIEKLEHELMSVRENIETYIALGKSNEQDAIEDKKDNITDRLIQLDIENQNLKQAAKMKIAPAITGPVGVEMLSQPVSPPPVLESKNTTAKPNHDPFGFISENDTHSAPVAQEKIHNSDVDFPEDCSYIDMTKGGLGDVIDDDLYEEDS